MPQTLSITDAPDDVVERLRARAARHHHSLEAELPAILKEAAAADALAGPAAVLAHDECKFQTETLLVLCRR